MSFLEFDCGCKIPLVNGVPKIDYYSLDLTCPKAWKIYQDGYTQSIFQLESYLGKTWSKKLKPSNIPDGAALISVIRPGCLQSEDNNGVSLTKVYCDRKNSKWVAPADPLSQLLEKTFGINIYQETSMELAKELAGFDGSQQMRLIKGIGKKKADIIFGLRKEFIDGCKNVGKITEEEANKVFDNIESSARYAFNKCILGTQKLKQICKGSNKFHATVEELYKITTDINYAKQTGHISLYKKHKLHKCFGYALSMCDDRRIRKNKIKNIQPAGIKQCFVLETESGKTCEVTDNHKFPTPFGDKQLKDLKIGDELYICDKYEKQNGKKYSYSNFNNKEIRDLRKNGGGKMPHGNFKEWSKNVKILRKINICAKCRITPKRLEVHHKNGDRCDNSMTNLESLCVSCHKKEEYASGRVKRGEKGYPRLTEKIKSIVAGSTGMTYDITMEAPNHNYVVDTGIVSCNSHAVSYAVTGYWTAWAKSHLPKHYICAWLRNAKNEQKPLEEIRAVVSEARRLNIPILPPSIRNLPTTNFFIKGHCVHFGLDSIKGCGQKGVSKLTQLDIDFEAISWMDFLVTLSPLVNKTQVISMIRSGCFDYTDINRSKCEYEYNQLTLLSKPELTKAQEIYERDTPFELTKLIESVIEEGKSTVKRKAVLASIVESLKNPAFSLTDSRDNIIAHEKELMGINISCSAIDKASIPDARDTCSSVDNAKNNSTLILVGEITECREIKIKNGKMAGQSMMTLQLVDESGSCDCVIFPKELSFYEGGVYDGNVIMVKGKKNNRGGVIIEKVYEV